MDITQPKFVKPYDLQTETAEEMEAEPAADEELPYGMEDTDEMVDKEIEQLNMSDKDMSTQEEVALLNTTTIYLSIIPLTSLNPFSNSNPLSYHQINLLSGRY